MNPGTSGGGMLTSVGDNCLFMVGVHVAHDCRIGDNVIMANNATLAGHVVIGDCAVFGGLSAVHQFVRIGNHAMIGGVTGVERDVIPYGQVVGDRARLEGLNIVGMQRRGFSREQVQASRAAPIRLLFGNGDGTFADRVAAGGRRQFGAGPRRCANIVDFIRAVHSRRDSASPRPMGGAHASASSPASGELRRCVHDARRCGPCLRARLRGHGRSGDGPAASPCLDQARRGAASARAPARRTASRTGDGRARCAGVTLASASTAGLARWRKMLRAHRPVARSETTAS